MNIKRGILIALTLYLVTLIVGVVLLYFARTTLSSPQNIPTTYWIITIVTTVILTSLASLWYFNKAKRSITEGLKLGVTFSIVGFIIDIIIFLSSQENAFEAIKEYYTNISFYIVILLVIGTCIFVGSRVHHNTDKENIKIKKSMHHHKLKHVV